MRPTLTTVNTLIAALAASLLTGCIGFDRGEYEILDTPNAKHVIMLPGITGTKPLFPPMTDYAGLRQDLKERGVSVDVWNWTKHDSVRGKTIPQSLNPRYLREVASDLVRRIQTIREAQKAIDYDADTKPTISIVAASGGCLVTAMACDMLDENDVLDAVVLVSAYFERNRKINWSSPDREKRPVSRVYNYTSKRDAYLKWCSTGKTGTETKGVYQLDYGTVKHKLDNYGGHVRAMEPKFFERYFVPIFTDEWGEGIQDEWKLTE